MRQIAFDTLKFAEKLILSGVPEKQAKAQVEALVEVTQMNLDGLSTKHDLQETESRLDHKILALQNDLRDTENRLKQDIVDLRHDLRQTEARLESKIEQFRFELDAKIDRVHDKLDAKIDKLSAELNGKFKLLYWMLGIVIVGVGSLVAGMATYILKLPI